MTGTSIELAKLAQIINGLQSAVVVAHYNPDPDALGSSLGLGLALQQQGKEVSVINESAVPQRFRDMPGSHEITPRVPPAGKYSALIVLDCGEWKRIGDTLAGALPQFDLVINIDHHHTNSLFGSLNLVDPGASSTSELVYRLLKELDWKLTPQVATNLYTGISGDTGSFQYRSTSTDTFFMAADLVKAGASPVEIGDMLYGSKPVAQVRLEALALSKIEILHGGKISKVVVTEDMYQACNATPQDTEDLVESARGINGVLVAIMIRKEGDLWKVSLRSKDAGPNVAEVASIFGGGGHKPAAAFRWRKSLEELEERLVAEIKQRI